MLKQLADANWKERLAGIEALTEVHNLCAYYLRFRARLWNSNPSNLKELNSKNFKKQIHKMLIEILENEDQTSILTLNLLLKAFTNFSFDFLIAFSFLLFDTDII